MMLKRIFKYIEYRPIQFENFLFRASNRHALNDPFEVQPAKSFWLDTFLTIETETYSGKTEQQIKNSIRSSNLETLERIYVERYEEYGIISFTETNDNLLMWSHYADDHKGVAIEFDYEHPFFHTTNADGNDYIGEISPVLYRKERIKKLGDFLIEPYFHKSDEWIYEKEHRLLLPLFNADETWVDKNYFTNNHKAYFDKIQTESLNDKFLKVLEFRSRGKMYQDYESSPNFYFMFKIPPESIKAVYLGCKFEKRKIPQIRSQLAQNVHGCKIFQATTDKQSYSLIFEEI